MSWVNDWSEMKPSAEKVPLPVQDPKWFAATRVRVLRPFCVAGKRCEIGTETQVPYHVALDLKAIGKAELI
ncbi:MAG: hypothetical protein MRJ68_16300 [Nitrospira sp.]|nr:hypothetical protein [Nitrospira sp.]